MMIAIQHPGAVAWTSAAPVTGTVGNFGFENAATYITTEETEPLGQTLRQNDPAEPPQPLPNDPNIGSADYPQWQCTAGEDFYGSFSAMPFHCQKAMLQDFSKGLDEIFGFSNPNRPANPTRISIRSIGGLDSPLRLPSIPYLDSSGGKSPNNLALAKMLQITAKPKIEDEQQVVAKVNVPISFDDDEPLLEIDFSDTGVIDASVSGATQQSQTAPLPADLALALDNRLKKGDCEDAVNKVLAELSKKKSVVSTNITDVFNKVKREGGINLKELYSPKEKQKIINEIKKGNHPDVNLGYSYSNSKGKVIDIEPLPIVPYPSGTTLDNNFFQYNYLTTLIHELFHQTRDGSGTFDHKQIRKAALAVDKNTTIGKTDSDTIDNFIKAHCPF